MNFVRDSLRGSISSTQRSRHSSRTASVVISECAALSAMPCSVLVVLISPPPPLFLFEQRHAISALVERVRRQHPGHARAYDCYFAVPLIQCPNQARIPPEL